MNYRSSLLLLTAFSVLGCSHVADKNLENRIPGSTSDRGNLVAEANFPLLDFKSMSALITESKAKSVSQALLVLSRYYGTYLKFHTLMYDSRSLQGSTFEEPRAIVFGPKADFIFTFNGNAHQRGGATIETAEFNSVNNTFQYREILFKNESLEQADTLKEDEIEQQTENIRISKANPGKCALCHTASGTPIWDTYFIWPGAYGSNDDILSQSLIPTDVYANETAFSNANNTFFNNIKIQSQGRTIKTPSPDIETDKYLNFLISKPNHSRYRHLPNRTIDELALKNASGVLVRDLNAKQIILDTAQRLSVKVDALYRPNGFLMDKLYEKTILRFMQDALNLDIKRKFAQEGLKIEMFEKNESTNQYKMDFPSHFAKVATKKLGSFHHFFIELAKKDIEMQCSRMSIMRTNLGDLKYGDVGTENIQRSYKTNKPDFCSEEDYKYAQLTENDIEPISRMAYVLEYFDISLSNYAINLGRVQTMSGSGFENKFRELFE